jgi:hypothetical protein
MRPPYQNRARGGLAKALPPVANSIEFVSKPSDSVGLPHCCKGAETASQLQVFRGIENSTPISFGVRQTI